MKRYSFDRFKERAPYEVENQNGSWVLHSDATAKLAALEAERDEWRRVASAQAGLHDAAETALEGVLEERDRLRERLVEAKTVVSHLMLSADANWELKRIGHDWADACEKARAFLAQKEPSDV